MHCLAVAALLLNFGAQDGTALVAEGNLRAGDATLLRALPHQFDAQIGDMRQITREPLHLAARELLKVFAKGNALRGDVELQKNYPF